MPKARKQEKVKELTRRFKDASGAMFAEYRGLTVKDATELRRSLLEAETSFAVVKNTLTKLAAKEAGLKDFETTAWWGVFAPANLPEAVAKVLHAAIDAVVRSDAFRDRLNPLGVQAMGGSRADFAQFQKKEIEKWGRSVRQSGATVD